MKVTICNGKGGPGKTTVSVLLAYALDKAGYSVGFLDRDPQGSSTEWFDDDDQIGVTVLTERSNQDEFDATIIDTPPMLASQALKKSIAESDVILVVSRPSPGDLKTTVDTARLIEKTAKKGTKVRLVFNQVQRNTLLCRHMDSMAEKVGLTPLKHHLVLRQAYQHATVMGYSSFDERTRTEIIELALEVVGIYQKRA